MSLYQEAEIRDRKRRRRERVLIAALFVIILVLANLGFRVFRWGIDLPISNLLLIFALININVILLLLLLFLTVRNLVKLAFERRKSIMGAKLRTKLVLAFVTLSLLPTTILFFVSVQFISASMEYWFNLQIEQSLESSLEVGRGHYQRIADELLSFGNNMSRVITHESLMLLSNAEGLEKYVQEKRKEYRLTSARVISTTLETRCAFRDHQVDLSEFSEVGADVLRNSIEKGMDAHYILSSRHGELVCGIVPVFSRSESKAVVGLLEVARFMPGSLVNRLNAISKGLQEYRQLKMLKKPIKISHMIWLSIVTGLILFSSVWFGFYLSQGITVPIRELAEGTKRVASGDYDFSIQLESKDEIGVLVNAFNRMTADLKAGRSKLDQANQELRKSNVEIEQRRLYMEIVLANVAAGVISADAAGKILTMNKSAEKMLNIQADRIIGKNYRELLSEEYAKTVDRFLGDEGLFRKGFIKRQIRFAVENRVVTLLLTLNVLRDDRGQYLGLVAVIEDLTEIEKAQRMAAWREVARRIAHEVKNPLTPIQLSAQRLKKRYGDRLASDEGKVFTECTDMIIKQVDELKHLVDEFSNFARMPAINPAPANLSELIEEALSLFREAHKEVKIVFNDSGDVPVFNLDREQMKRVMINLMDNAIAAVDGSVGEVTVDLSYDMGFQTVKIEVADNGRGISPEHKRRLFEPYFSTKKHGTGLGLAIVNTIVTDHNGFIRVQDNQPRGTRVIIELPVRV
jgi:two-component system nitrogen regulation sensor histidine kinase NtrY